MATFDYDVFISHAYEDKPYVDQLAADLLSREVKVWYSGYELKVGDSIFGQITKGLQQSAFGIVVLSPTYVQKEYAMREMIAFFNQEVASKTKRILPIWHNFSHQQAIAAVPLLADHMAVGSDTSLEHTSRKLIEVINQAREEQAKPSLSGEVTLHMPHIQAKPAYADLKYKMSLGQTKEVLTQLISITQDKASLNDEAILQSGRYHGIYNRHLKGVMSESDFQMQVNRINHALLDLINRL